MSPRLRNLISCALMVLLAGQILPSQRSKRPALLRDPYTRNDPEQLAKLGYASMGPFAWGQGYGTDHIRQAVGAPGMLWVETAHFKLGMDLPRSLVPGESRWRRPFTEELGRLKKRLPRVVARNRKLSRWLRLHLYAQRMEELYAEFSKRLGVTDRDFPSLDGSETPGKFMGSGPYLGQRGKYCVLMFQSRASLERYLKQFPKIDGGGNPTRHTVAGGHSLAFATATECFEGRLVDDRSMHSHVVGHVVEMLADGYKSRFGPLPVWFVKGLSHWFRRRIEPRINLIREDQDWDNMGHRSWDWSTRVYGRVRHDYFPTAVALCDQRSASKWGLQEHMMCWSRVDFLMQRHPKGLRRFLDFLCDHPIPLASVSVPRARAWQFDGLARSWLLTPVGFDAQWRQFVLTNYRR